MQLEIRKANWLRYCVAQ